MNDGFIALLWYRCWLFGRIWILLVFGCNERQKKIIMMMVLTLTMIVRNYPSPSGIFWNHTQKEKDLCRHKNQSSTPSLSLSLRVHLFYCYCVNSSSSFIYSFTRSLAHSHTQWLIDWLIDWIDPIALSRNKHSASIFVRFLEGICLPCAATAAVGGTCHTFLAIVSYQ